MINDLTAGLLNNFNGHGGRIIQQCESHECQPFNQISSISPFARRSCLFWPPPVVSHVKPRLCALRGDIWVSLDASVLWTKCLRVFPVWHQMAKVVCFLLLRTATLLCNLFGGFRSLTHWKLGWFHVYPGFDFMHNHSRYSSYSPSM